MDPAEDILVDQGSFRIDRKRALDKLMRFQLPDARMYPLPWVQAAVASHAEHIYLSPLPAGFEMAFAGDPWDPKDLEDPYRHLFEEDPGGGRARHRELVIGLLSALRIKPDHISVMFAHQGTECILRIKSLTMEQFDTRPGRPLADQQDRYGASISISIFVAVRAHTSFAKEVEFIKKHCRHCPIPITVGRKVLPMRGRSKKPVLMRGFSKDGAQGKLELDRDAFSASRVDLVTHGVTVATERLMLPGLQGAAVVRDDALRKSLSQMGVIKEDRYQNTLRTLEDASVELLKETISRAVALAPGVGEGLKKPSLRRYWMPWINHSLREKLETLLAPGELAGKKTEEKEQSKAARMSLFAAALREAAFHRRIDMLKHQRGVPELLWDAPVLFDRTGKPLTLRTLEMQRRWLGHVPCADSPSRTASGILVAAWTVRERDRTFLEEFFPREVRPVAGSAAEAPPAVRPVLEDKNLIVKHRVESGGLRGEIGLSLSPHTRATRIRWLSGGRPVGRSTWPFNSLRLEAAIDHTGIVAVPRRGTHDAAAAQCLAAIFAAAGELYRAAAQSYAPLSATTRNGIIREHLLDLMASSWDEGKSDCPDHPWLADLALLRDTQGRMLSLHDIRERCSRKEAVTLRASTHPVDIQHLFIGYPDHLKALFAGSSLAVKIEQPPEPAPEEEKPPPRPKPVPPAAPPPAARRQHESRRKEAPLPSAANNPVEDLAADPAEELRRWLAALMDLEEFPLSEDACKNVRFARRTGKPLLSRGKDFTWTVNTAHPLIQAIERRGGTHLHIAYLISVYVTGVNRAEPGVTNEADARFNLRLAEFIMEADERAGH